MKNANNCALAKKFKQNFLFCELSIKTLKL